MKRSRNRARRWLVPAAVVAVAAGCGAAFAAFPQTDVKSYTGCVGAAGSAGGLITQVAEGDAPLKPCSSNQREIHLSGGDITAVAVGAGLTGGGENGAVSIGLDAGHSLPQSCQAGQVPKASATSGWDCGADQDTTYVNGPGLALSGNQFSIASGYQLPQGCSNGQVPERQTFGWSCTSQSDPEAWTTFVAFGNVPQGSNAKIAELTLPAGIFLINASGTAVDDGGSSADDEVSVECRLFRAESSVLAASWVDVGDEASLAGPAGQIAMTTVSGFTNTFAPWKLSLYCTSQTGSDHLQNVELSAVRLGDVHT